MQVDIRTLAIRASFVSMFCLAGCAGEPQQQSKQLPTWEEFRANVYQEPDTGIFIVNGDEPVLNEARLREFYAQMSGQAALANEQEGLGTTQQSLTLLNIPGWANHWSIPAARNLTYCISSASFGGYYSSVVSAMNTAATNWENTGANINFVHSSSLDSSCDNTTNVTFNVRMVDTQGEYLARAFFPPDPRYAREILIDVSSFGYISPWTLAGVLRHELGHTLGFRHEHLRIAQSDEGCQETDPYWRAVTAYDSASVMHYPQCAGTNTGDLNLTALDVTGVKAIYPAALLGGQRLLSGQSISSNDGRFTLVLQGDGNLVHYWNGNGAVWSTSTWNTGGLSVWMQEDGNFVLYTTFYPTVGYSLWSSGTYGNTGAYLAVQNDGNLVVYDSTGKTALWASNTGGH
jgi:dual-action HEIGH metallo-peptidase